MSRVVLAMSGGVDSSVAAHLLVNGGFDVVGVFMRHGEKAAEACSLDGNVKSSPLLPLLQKRMDHKQGCCSALDAEDARRVADRLNIPFYALNLEQEFRTIIDYFVQEYSTGRTPNPCVQCNNKLKFGHLFEYADSIGAEYVATGHYARITRDSATKETILRRGVDQSKDQSYALFGVDRARLRRMMLPIGEYCKSEIREMARGFGIAVSDKRDSQEICFVTAGHHSDFVRDRRKNVDLSGEIVTSDGHVVGEHAGIEGFTIGQRKGLGVALGEPYYVVRIEPETRRVVLGRHSELARTKLTARQCNWLVEPVPSSFRCQAKIRYNGEPASATARFVSPDQLHVDFDEPRHGIAPGQAVVCYDGHQVLGGGWID